MEAENFVLIAVVLTAIGALACVVNGYLGAGLAIFSWFVLLGVVSQPVAVGANVLRVTENTWAPHLLLPLAGFLVAWQARLRGRIGAGLTLRSLVSRPQRKFLSRRSVP
jgi:ABC-type microcin C transport system permease subunit YejB